MNNRALILAAGRGSRMKENTKLRPKCFTSLDGKTLLEWQIGALKSGEIKDISVVTGYRSELFSGLYKKFHNPRWEKTNMVSSLFCADEFNGDTIVSYSDIVYKNDHIKKLCLSKSDITITADKNWLDLWKLRFFDPLDDAETFQCVGNKLTGIGDRAKDISEIEAQYMGLLKLSSSGWQTMYKTFNKLSSKVKDKLDMTSMLKLLIQNNIEINIVFVSGGWCEADTKNDILVYENMLSEKSNWLHNWK